jgi:tRNA threonylcarbamoyladenosine biosynthesis protein TsaB
MKILAVDTSGQSLSVALLIGDQVVHECTQSNGLTHSESLMPLIDAAMRAGGVTPADMDRFAVVTGPGSFTGVRIGVAAIKAMAQVTDKPCVGVNALQALAHGVYSFSGAVCALRDARAGQVYCAAFLDGQYVLKDAAISIDAFLVSVAPLGTCCFVGDGADVHQERITQKMGPSAVFPPRSHALLRASNVALLALHMEPVDCYQLAPYYLRAPQAERERLAREARQ